MNQYRPKTTKVAVTVEKKYAKYIRQSDLQELVDMIIKHVKGVLLITFSDRKVDKYKIELTKYPKKSAKN